MTPRDWHLNLSNRLGLSLDFQQFSQGVEFGLGSHPIHPDSLFEQLSKPYRLGLLSNTDPIHVAHLESTYSFFHYFPHAVRIYSCSVGASKPDPLMFREALRACKVGAEQAVYIDDIAAYVDAASALGCSGIHFRSPEQLHQDLGALGVKTRVNPAPRRNSSTCIHLRVKFAGTSTTLLFHGFPQLLTLQSLTSLICPAFSRQLACTSPGRALHPAACFTLA